MAAGQLQEAFGIGTAVTIAPIATIGYEDQDHDLPALTDASFSRRVGIALEAIRTGHASDSHGWMEKVS